MSRVCEESIIAVHIITVLLKLAPALTPALAPALAPALTPALAPALAPAMAPAMAPALAPNQFFNSFTQIRKICFPIFPVQTMHKYICINRYVHACAHPHLVNCNLIQCHSDIINFVATVHWNVGKITNLVLH